MTRQDAQLIHRSGGWRLTHLILAEGESEPTRQVRWFRDPTEAVETLRRCGPDGCSAECRRARRAGLRGWVAMA